MNNMKPSGAASELHDDALSGSRVTRHVAKSDIIFINNASGYPDQIARARLTRDARDACAVEQLSQVVLGREMDDLLHFSVSGTYVALTTSAQVGLWDTPEATSVAALTGLIQQLNRWMEARTKILRGARNVHSRIAASDDALDELGYVGLRATLLRLARGRPRELHIRDVAGNGGILQIPPRGHFSQVPKITPAPTPASEGDSIQVRGIEMMTQILTPAGQLIEAPTGKVDGSLVDGGRARAHKPRKATSIARHAARLHVIHTSGDTSHDKD